MMQVRHLHANARNNVLSYFIIFVAN